MKNEEEDSFGSSNEGSWVEGWVKIETSLKEMRNETIDQLSDLYLEE